MPRHLQLGLSYMHESAAWSHQHRTVRNCTEGCFQGGQRNQECEASLWGIVDVRMHLVFRSMYMLKISSRPVCGAVLCACMLAGWPGQFF